MKTITIIAQKGGVGKTTTAAALGAGLMLYRGARVLFVDLDAQMNLSHTLEADTEGGSPSALDVLTGRSSAGDAIQHTPHGDIIAASPDLAGADALRALSSTGREYRLREALKPLSGSYDYCVIDTPPALGILSINALTAANKAIIPTEADKYSWESVLMLQGTLEAVKAYTNRALTVDGVLITKYSRANVTSYFEERLEEAAEKIGSRLYSVRIRQCVAIKAAQGLEEDIFTYAPKSNAAKDYRALVEEVAPDE